MNEIYPSEESRQALTVFHLYEGSGEWFDLSKKPIERASFTIGSKQEEKQGYEITQKCNGCRTCQTVCPQDCIDFSIVPAVIRQGNCLHCGNCFHVCPQKAVIRRG
ncbi:4Fe-4S dicluster domain-containing protein [Massilicoli timonensis]|nr:4Fe-4S dicluster domain-containing protein [Massilicoli timonensis]